MSYKLKKKIPSMMWTSTLKKMLVLSSHIQFSEDGECPMPQLYISSDCRLWLPVKKASLGSEFIALGAAVHWAFSGCFLSEHVVFVFFWGKLVKGIQKISLEFMHNGRKVHDLSILWEIVYCCYSLLTTIKKLMLIRETCCCLWG